jgi:hypothetical protein
MPEDYVGRSPDELALAERLRLSGKWIALELYTPKTLPVRLIEAVGDSATECVRMLRARGRDPHRYEFSPFRA